MWKNVNYDVLNSLTEATNGYPFMIQLVGYWSWRYSDVNNHLDRVHMEDAQQGIKKLESVWAVWFMVQNLTIFPQWRKIT